MKWVYIAAVLVLCSTLISCKQEEMDDIAKAQQCLDNIPQSDPESAVKCLPYVQKYNSQQANILKCSIYMTSGGLVESKIVAAYNAVEDGANNHREAAFMSILALNKPDVSTGYSTAVTADSYCQATGVPGLQYISGIVKIGSFLAKTIASYSTVDFNDPAAAAAAVNDLVAKCNTDPRSADCGSDLSAIGSTASTLANGYCKSDAESDVCKSVTSAVGSANGDPAKVGDALMCYLGKKTYNATTGKCNP